MKEYIDQISKLPVLSREEEDSLLVKFTETQSSAIKEKIVRHNLKLVVHIAKRYRARHAGLIDLIQEGNIGLMRAVEKFDPERGFKFSTYAGYWIRAMILRSVINNAHLVKVGTTDAQRKLFFNMAKVRAKLEANGIEATVSAMAKELNMEEGLVREMDERLSAGFYSINADKDDDFHGTSRHWDVTDPKTTWPSIITEDKEITDKVSSLMKEFYDSLEKEKWKDIFYGRYMKDEEDTYSEIGSRCGVSRQRVEQIDKNRIQPRLKQFMRSRGING